MKFILRLGLALLTGFVSVSTASAQAYGTADTNAPELRVPKSVQPAFDYWMRDTWATLGPDGYYYITGTTSTPDRHFPGQRHSWDWNDESGQWKKTVPGRKIPKYIKRERNMRRSLSIMIRWITVSTLYGHRKCTI